MSKKIGIFSISDTLGGAEQVLFKISKFYSKDNDYSVKVFFFQKKTTNFWYDNLDHDVKLFYFRDNYFTFFREISNGLFFRLYSSHLMVNALLGLARLLSIVKSKQLVVRESTSVFPRYKGFKIIKYYFAYWLGYRKIDLIICQSERMKKELLEKVSFLKKRTQIKVIFNPFDYQSKLISNSLIEVDNDFIVSAGRYIPEKGFDILIEAFRMVLQKFPKQKLLILGEGKERNFLSNIIEKNNLEENVILVGFVDNVYSYFYSAKLCVVSSRIEGFPNVLLQMMSQNEKVVSTKCAGGIEDISGIFLAETHDAKSLSNAIILCLDNDTDGNRKIFDSELLKRSINNFISCIDIELINYEKK